MLPDKYAEETIILTFDFAATVAKMGIADTTLISPLVTLPAAVGEGSLTNVSQLAIGLQMRVLVSGGERGAKYHPACLATFSNGERRKLTDALLVK